MNTHPLPRAISWLVLPLLISLETVYSADEHQQVENENRDLVTLAKWYDPAFWLTVDGKPPGMNWEFDNEEIRLVKPRGGSGSLLSQPLPKNFELSWKWKLNAGTNSGLKYRVQKSGSKWLGLEFQMIDEKPKSSSKSSTASIYDLVAPLKEKVLHPAGTWNHSKVIASGDKIQHYLNNQLVAEAITQGPNWDSEIAKSKFWGVSNFGRISNDQRIMLTDHGGKVIFKDFQGSTLAEPGPVVPVKSGPYLANGIRNGWVDQTSAVIWTRTTQNAQIKQSGSQFIQIGESVYRRLAQSGTAEECLESQLPDGATLSEMIGACPGVSGEVRLSYFPEKQTKAIKSTKWKSTSAKDDFTAQWHIKDLVPDRQYAVIIEARASGSQNLTAVYRGSLRTAPSINQKKSINFCMTTCHDFFRRDDGFSGHKIYPSMTRLQPDFMVHAGDIEYYDKPQPWALTLELMRFKWSRIFSLPNNRQFYGTHTSYFIKDDHDTLKNDCWPGQRYGSVTFEQGKQLFNLEQFPSKPQRYQTIQWGPDLQIWLLEGRDFRSPNTMMDGPEKTILGSKQKEWLAETLQASKAQFKIIFSPTPIVGPDRRNKKDNHANETFAHEGEQLRRMIASVEGAIVFCGDRHWQYASVDRTNGLWEFGCGPGSEKHQFGWREGELHPSHEFLRVAGGFLSGELTYPFGDQAAPQLSLRHHKVTGEVVSEFNFTDQ
ncbi:DUF1080 domain-containing protein [bacterium]|nr:DUF1080 domain-containing protein [bacterium]